MKKFLVLVLALAMALAIAVPAMAFVDYAYSSVGELKLDFYFVDYSESTKLFNNGGIYVADPAADRGYALNEVVGAVASVEVPKGYDKNDVTLKFTGTNVRYQNIVSGADTQYNAATVAAVGTPALFTVAASGKDITTTNAFAVGTASAAIDSSAKFQYLVMAKVVDDDASMNVRLSHNSGTNNEKLDANIVLGTQTDSIKLGIGGAEYTITLAANSATPTQYLYSVTSDEYNAASNTLYMLTDASFKGLAMFAKLGATDADYYRVAGDGRLYKLASTPVAVTPNSPFEAGSYSGIPEASKINGFVADVINALKLDPSAIGAKVKVDYFNSFVDNTIAQATLDIEPWTAHVTVPDVDVVNPPKTGDAASLLGFAMLFAAVVGAVVCKKVRA